MAHVKEKYWNSKVPLWLALLFVLNILLVLAVELLAVYRYPAAIDEIEFEGLDPMYAGAAIVSQSERNALHCCMIETADGSTHLLSFKGHPFFANRTKFLSAQQLDLPTQEGFTEVPVKDGIHTAIVHVYQNTVDMQFVHTTTLKEALPFYVIIAVLIELLELGIWKLIRQH